MLQANLLRLKPFIKINACLLGYSLWIMLSQHQIITRTLQVPVYFYNIQDTAKITCLDTIDVTLQAYKKNFTHFDIYNSAIYIDATHLHLGDNKILVQKENLFLPDEIKLVNLLPSSLSIQLQKAE